MTATHRENPVLKRELVSRFRSRKQNATNQFSQTVAVLGFINLLMLWIMARNNVRAEDWQMWFFGLAYLQLVLVCILSPAICASLFTREREQQTLDLLLLTLLSPFEICWGKLVSRMASIGVLLAAFLPLMLLIALAGHVPLWSFIGTYSVLIVCSFAFGGLGMFCSALFRRTPVSTGAAVGVTAIILVGLPLVASYLRQPYPVPYPKMSIYEYVVDNHPFAAILELTEDQHVGLNLPTRPLWFPPWSVWLHTVIWYGSFGTGLFALLCTRLRRLCAQ